MNHLLKNIPLPVSILCTPTVAFMQVLQRDQVLGIRALEATFNEADVLSESAPHLPRYRRIVPKGFLVVSAHACLQHIAELMRHNALLLPPESFRSSTARCSFPCRSGRNASPG